MVICHNEGLESQAKLRDEEETIRSGYLLIQVTRLIVLKGYQKQKEWVAKKKKTLYDKIRIAVIVV